MNVFGYELIYFMGFFVNSWTVSFDSHKSPSDIKHNDIVLSKNIWNSDHQCSKIKKWICDKLSSQCWYHWSIYTLKDNIYWSTNSRTKFNVILRHISFPLMNEIMNPDFCFHCYFNSDQSHLQWINQS